MKYLILNIVLSVLKGGSWLEWFTFAGCVSAIGVCVALYSFKKNIRASIDHAKASIALQCLQRYLDITEHRTDAIIKQNDEIATQYWRELVDLMWSEYHLWRNGYIEDSSMEIWCKVRRYSYANDAAITFDKSADANTETYNQTMAIALAVSVAVGKDAEAIKNSIEKIVVKGSKLTEKVSIYYRHVWNDLIQNYFPEGDSFPFFLNEIHGLTTDGKNTVDTPRDIKDIFKQYKKRPLKHTRLTEFHYKMITSFLIGALLGYCIYRFF